MNGRVYTDYDPIRIVWGKADSTDADLQLVADRAGLSGVYASITDLDIPNDRIDRDTWEFKSGKVKVNDQKKAEKDAEKAAKKARKDSVLAKLGITEEELKDLGGI